MKSPWVNSLLLILLIIQSITGYFGMINGRETSAWILWLHGIVAYALLLLLLFKLPIVVDAWRRKKRWTGNRVGFLLTLLLLLIVISLGLLWTFNGPIYIGVFSLVSIHIYAAIPLMLLMLYHMWHMRFIFKVDGAGGRRLFLGGIGLTLAGLIFRGAAERFKPLAGYLGGARRFTGSYEKGSFSTTYPVVSWIADRPGPVYIEEWSLVIDGEVNNPVALSYKQLDDLPQLIVTATLDCTGGWYCTQNWRGVSVGDLLAQAGVRSTASSVTFESVTGYRRRFPVEEAQDFLLALGTIVDDSTGRNESYLPLNHGHGFPIRLIAPGRRGMEWVKWIAAIQVNRTGPLLQSPLPLQ